MKLLVKSLAVLNAGEGAIHLLTSAISFWGIFATGAYDWRIMTAPAVDLLLGFVSLITGYVLGTSSWCRTCPHQVLPKT